jgi:hypothetical protein
MEPKGSLPHSKKLANSEAFVNYFVTRLSLYGEETLAPRSAPIWKTTPCRLSTTAYSINSQLPPYLQAVPEDVACRGDRDSHITVVHSKDTFAGYSELHFGKLTTPDTVVTLP